jgi:hypothetical protein
VQTLITAVVLAAFGIGAIALGVFAWRSAQKLVTDARQTLRAMFGESLPGLFAEEPDPRGARIGGAAFIVAGAALLVAAAVVALL